MRTDRRVLFLHVPKTAGTSLRELLSCRFARNEILTFSRSDSKERRLAKVRSVGSYSFVHGHVPYAILNYYEQRPAVVTILRDPLERAVSAYYHMRRQIALGELAGVHDSRIRDYQAASRLSLDDFVCSERDAAARHLGNLQTWMFSTPNFHERFEFGEEYKVAPCNADLERAKDNLSTCDVVGLTEQLNDSVDLLAYALGERPFGPITTANRTAERPALNSLSSTTITALAEITSYDRELYRFATTIFAERRAAMMRKLLLRNAEFEVPVSAGSRYPSSFTFERAIPGEGWYAPERTAEQWFSWTGPTQTATIELGSPASRDCCLRIRVVHAMEWHALSTIEVRVNGIPLQTRVEQDASGATLTSSVPEPLLKAPEDSNLISIRVPRLIRPCECGIGAQDSRPLGVAVANIELAAA